MSIHNLPLLPALQPRVAASMSQPFYDLCVSTTLLEPQTQRERVSQAIKLGWDAVALVHQAAAKLTEQDRWGAEADGRQVGPHRLSNCLPASAHTAGACTGRSSIVARTPTGEPMWRGVTSPCDAANH